MSVKTEARFPSVFVCVCVWGGYLYRYLCEDILGTPHLRVKTWFQG